MWIEKEFLKSRDEKRKKKTLKGKFEGKEERKKVFFNRKAVTRINVGEVSAKEKMFFLFWLPSPPHVIQLKYPVLLSRCLVAVLNSGLWFGLSSCQNEKVQF